MKRRDFLRKSLLATTGSIILGGGIVKAVENLSTKNSSRMKIAVLTGSPRRNGNSAYLAEQFIKGAQEYAINGKIKDHYKKAAYLMAYADTSKKEAEPMLVHYHTLMNYLGWESVGEVVAPGVWTAGSIRNTRYGEQAYQLGKSI